MMMGEAESIRFQKCLNVIRRYTTRSLCISLLDLGGWNTPVKPHLPQCSVTLADWNEQADIILDFNKPFKFKKRYDMIFAGEILEHTTHPPTFLKAVRRALKPEGVLLLTTPNIASLKNRLKLLLGFQPTFTIHGYKHYFIFTLKTLKNLLSECGFKVEEVHGDGIVFTNKWKWMGRLTSIYPRLSHHLIILCSKKEGV